MFVLEETTPSGLTTQEHPSHGGNLPPVAPHRDTTGHTTGNKTPEIRNIGSSSAKQAGNPKTEHPISEHSPNAENTKHTVLQGTEGLEVQSTDTLFQKNVYGLATEPSFQVDLHPDDAVITTSDPFSGLQDVAFINTIGDKAVIFKNSPERSRTPSPPQASSQGPMMKENSTSKASSVPQQGETTSNQGTTMDVPNDGTPIPTSHREAAALEIGNLHDSGTLEGMKPSSRPIPFTDSSNDPRWQPSQGDKQIIDKLSNGGVTAPFVSDTQGVATKTSEDASSSSSKSRRSRKKRGQKMRKQMRKTRFANIRSPSFIQSSIISRLSKTNTSGIKSPRPDTVARNLTQDEDHSNGRQPNLLRSIGDHLQSTLFPFKAHQHGAHQLLPTDSQGSSIGSTAPQTSNDVHPSPSNSNSEKAGTSDDTTLHEGIDGKKTITLSQMLQGTTRDKSSVHDSDDDSPDLIDRQDSSDEDDSDDDEDTEDETAKPLEDRTPPDCTYGQTPSKSQEPSAVLGIQPQVDAMNNAINHEINQINNMEGAYDPTLHDVFDSLETAMNDIPCTLDESGNYQVQVPSLVTDDQLDDMATAVINRQYRRNEEAGIVPGQGNFTPHAAPRGSLAPNDQDSTKPMVADSEQPSIPHMASTCRVDSTSFNTSASPVHPHPDDTQHVLHITDPIGNTNDGSPTHTETRSQSSLPSNTIVANESGSAISALSTYAGNSPTHAHTRPHGDDNTSKGSSPPHGNEQPSDQKKSPTDTTHGQADTTGDPPQPQQPNTASTNDGTNNPTEKENEDENQDPSKDKDDHGKGPRDSNPTPPEGSATYDTFIQDYGDTLWRECKHDDRLYAPLLTVISVLKNLHIVSYTNLDTLIHDTITWNNFHDSIHMSDNFIFLDEKFDMTRLGPDSELYCWFLTLVRHLHEAMHQAWIIRGHQPVKDIEVRNFPTIMTAFNKAKEALLEIVNPTKEIKKENPLDPDKFPTKQGTTKPTGATTMRSSNLHMPDTSTKGSANPWARRDDESNGPPKTHMQNEYMTKSGVLSDVTYPSLQPPSNYTHCQGRFITKAEGHICWVSYPYAVSLRRLPHNLRKNAAREHWVNRFFPEGQFLHPRHGNVIDITDPSHPFITDADAESHHYNTYPKSKKRIQPIIAKARAERTETSSAGLKKVSGQTKPHDSEKPTADGTPKASQRVTKEQSDDKPQHIRYAPVQRNGLGTIAEDPTPHGTSHEYNVNVTNVETTSRTTTDNPTQEYNGPTTNAPFVPPNINTSQFHNSIPSTGSHYGRSWEPRANTGYERQGDVPWAKPKTSPFHAAFNTNSTEYPPGDPYHPSRGGTGNPGANYPGFGNTRQSPDFAGPTPVDLDTPFPHGPPDQDPFGGTMGSHPTKFPGQPSGSQKSHDSGHDHGYPSNGPPPSPSDSSFHLHPGGHGDIPFFPDPGPPYNHRRGNGGRGNGGGGSGPPSSPGGGGGGPPPPPGDPHPFDRTPDGIPVPITSNFKIKPDPKDYRELEESSNHTEWDEDMKSTMRTHGCYDVWNPNYRPQSLGDYYSFQKKQAFMYDVLRKKVKTVQGKRIIRFHRHDFNAQAVLQALRVEARVSTSGRIRTQAELRKITLLKCDSSWTKPLQQFISYFQTLVEDYNGRCLDKDEMINETMAKIYLENSVQPCKVLHEVTLREMHLVASGGRPMNYQSYIAALDGVAQRVDERNRSRGPNRHALLTDISGAYETYDINPDDEIHLDIEGDEDPDLGTIIALLSKQVQKGRMGPAWSKVSDKTKELWDKMPEVDREAIKESMKGAIQKSKQPPRRKGTYKANLHETHEPTDQDTSPHCDTEEATMDVNNVSSGEMPTKLEKARADAHPGDPRSYMSVTPGATPHHTPKDGQNHGKKIEAKHVSFSATDPSDDNSDGDDLAAILNAYHEEDEYPDSDTDFWVGDS